MRLCVKLHVRKAAGFEGVFAVTHLDWLIVETNTTGFFPGGIALFPTGSMQTDSPYKHWTQSRFPNTCLGVVWDKTTPTLLHNLASCKAFKSDPERLTVNPAVERLDNHQDDWFGGRPPWQLAWLQSKEWRSGFVLFAVCLFFEHWRTPW